MILHEVRHCSTQKTVCERTIAALRIGCVTGATQKPVCKRTMKTLRIGCGTAAHGLGGVKHRRPDAFASGENEKKPAGK